MFETHMIGHEQQIGLIVQTNEAQEALNVIAAVRWIGHNNVMCWQLATL